MGTVGYGHGRSGARDLDGRELQFTQTAFADQVAAAADLVAGQAAQGRACVWMRGLRFEAIDDAASLLCREPHEDLYA